MSICACNSGAAIHSPSSRWLLRIQLEAGLRAPRTAPGGGDAATGISTCRAPRCPVRRSRSGATSRRSGDGERSDRGDHPDHGHHDDDRPRLQQCRGQRQAVRARIGLGVAYRKASVVQGNRSVGDRRKPSRGLLRLTSLACRTLCLVKDGDAAAGQRLVAGRHASGTPIALSPPGIAGHPVAVVGACHPGQRRRDDAGCAGRPGTRPAAVDDPGDRLAGRPRTGGANAHIPPTAARSWWRCPSRRGAGRSRAPGQPGVAAAAAGAPWNEDQRKSLLRAADLMSALVDEDA